MDIPTHFEPKEVFLEHVNGLVNPNMANQAPFMHLFDKKLSNYPLWNT